MTRQELAWFWDAQLRLWFQEQRLSPHLERWKQAYLGELQEWAFPEPFIGNLLGSPRIVLLANNPGVAREELQSRTGAFGAEITTRGFTAWAATRPFEGPDSEWEKRYGPIRHNRERLEFARRLLDDQSVQFADLVNVELYPWHSPRLTHSIRVQPETLSEFILEPLSEYGSDVPIVGLGKAWANALDRASEVVAGSVEFEQFRVPSRRARLYETHHGKRLLVVWHLGSDKPPAAEDVRRLREIWFGVPPAGKTGLTRRLPAASRTASTTGSGQREQRAGSPRAPGSGIRRRFASADDVAAYVENETIRRLVYSLTEWIAREFDGDAIANRRPTGQFRLHVLDGPADIGWDFKRQWVWIWVNKPLPGDRAALEAAVSSGVRPLASIGLSFKVANDDDAEALRALIERHVLAARRAA